MARHIAIIKDGSTWTVEEWVCHWIWMYLISQINSIELEMKLDEIKPDMKGALDPWPKVDEYFANLGLPSGLG